jgi:hypothetical protein
MRYYIKCKLNPEGKQKLADSIKSGSLARGLIFYEGMQTALREGTIDENDIVHFVEVCYCLEGGLYPMAMEIPVLNKYFKDIIEVALSKPFILDDKSYVISPYHISGERIKICQTSTYYVLYPEECQDATIPS